MSSIWTIRRSATDAKFAGVCGGVARHWHVDPVLVRVGFVLLALSGGIGLVLYVAGWLLVPIDGKDKPVVEDLLGEQANRVSRELWIVIVVLACIVSFVVLGTVTPFGFGPALILALIWYFGYYRTKGRRTPSAAPTSPTSPTGEAPAVPPSGAAAQAPTQFYSYSGPPTAFTEAAEAWRERITQVERETTARQSGQPPQPSAPSPQMYPSPGTYATLHQGHAWQDKPAEDRSEPTGWAQPPDSADQQAFLAHPDPVGLYHPVPVVTPVVVKPADRASARRLRLVGLVLLGLTLTGLAIADSAGLAVPPVAYLAAALLVVGLVLIAATWFGRARGILPIGILLAIATALATAVPQIPPPTDWKPHTLSYTSVASLPTAGDHLDTGTLDVDLSGLELTKDATYTAGVDLGAVTVTVPKDVNVVIDYSVDAGSVQALDLEPVSGTDLKDVIPAQEPDPAEPTLTLKLSADLGQIEVTR